MTKTVFPFVRKRVILITIIATLFSVILMMIASLVDDYKDKRITIEQLAELLATTASLPAGVTQVAEQVSDLLNNDPTLESIVFYSIEHPIDENQHNKNDWLDALTANTISIYHPVVSHQSSEFPIDQPTLTTNNQTLIGYINITLDVNKVRMYWFYQYIWLWGILLLVCFVNIFLILKTLKNPIQRLEELSKVAESISKNPNNSQLAIFNKESIFTETAHIKQAIFLLLQRIEYLQVEYERLKGYEEQVQDKGQSLDVQRSSFQSMITHELKTSLNAIFGGLQLLGNQYLTHEQQDALSIIRKGSEQLDFTLEQIIQLNKIEKGMLNITQVPFQPLQLLSELVTAFEPIAQEKNIKLISHITHVDYTLEGDAHKIQLILEALVDNAIKFTKEGSVTIESHLNHFDNNTRWTVKIIDTGIGVEKKYFEDIFTPFFQVDPSIDREYEGIGIGLSLAKQMSQLLNAQLEVSSEVGEGSQFSLTTLLQNWQQTQERNLLDNFSIIYFCQNQSSMLVDYLIEMGASVDIYQNVPYIIETMLNRRIDVLLLSQDVGIKKAKRLTQMVRQKEVSHRTLIVYFYPLAQQDSLDIADLNASGIDYCEPDNLSYEKIAGLLKQWLAI